MRLNDIICKIARQAVMVFALVCSEVAFAEVAFAEVVGMARSRGGYPLIVPQVQRLTPVAGSLVLPKKMSVNYPDELDIAPLARIYAQTVSDGTIERSGDSAFCSFMLCEDGFHNSTEGYSLVVAEQCVSIKAHDIHGLFNGMQTLCWMLRNRQKADCLPCCSIADWPDLRMRALFLQLYYITSAQVERVCHVIDTLGALKYNTLLMSLGDNFPFEGQPFSKRKTAPLSRTDIERILASARRNHIEVIPYVQLVSHTQWMMTYRDWESLREADNNCGYCLSNPAVQPVVEKLIRELTDFFKPRYFHIGLDEIEQNGIPKCPKCKAANLEDLMYNHLRPIVEMFTERGVKPIIYQDQFFGFGEPTVASGLPIRNLPERLGHSTVINSWEYWHFPSDAIGESIRRRCFDNLLYMSFAISADNSQNLPKLASRMGGMGNILAYWSMIPATLDAPDNPLPDFYPSIIAQANYCWNASDVELCRIPIDSAQVLIELLDGQQNRKFCGKATAIPMNGALNRKFAGDSVFPQFDKEIVAEMRRVAAADSAAFNLMDKDGAPLAVVLSGTKYDDFAKGPVTIPVGVKATGISFLMTAAVFNKFVLQTSVYRLKRMDIGTLRIVFMDGKHEDIPLTFLRNINDWNTYIAGNACRVVMRGNDCNGALFSLYAIDWRNPRPEEEIREIVMSSKGDKYISPVLFAASLSDAEKPPVGANWTMNIATTTRRAEIRRETAISFKDGVPKGTNAKGIGVKDFAIKVDGDAERGNVLEISMPACQQYLARPLVDMPLKNPRDFESVLFDIRLSDPKAFFKPDFYVMDYSAAHALSATSYFLETDDQWHTVCIPRERFAKDGGGIDPTKADVMSIRFFMHRWPTPVSVHVDDIYYCDSVLPCRINSTRPVK